MDIPLLNRAGPGKPLCLDPAKASVAQKEQNEEQNVLLKPNRCSWDRCRLR